MKNIFLIPTENPSRLYKGDNGLLAFGLMQTSTQSRNDYFTNQNIHITSDEKFIRDEYITDGLEVIKATPKLVDAQGLVNRRDWKKIIITTDPELIEDGVQEIDDEFLQWFVNNPSCDLVLVRDKPKVKAVVKGLGVKNFNNGYKIMFPKEESKQDAINYSLNAFKVPKEYFGKDKVYNNSFHYQTRWLLDFLSDKDYLTDKREVIEKEFEEYLKK